MDATPAHYDTLETRSPEERERALMQRLAKQVQHAKQHTAAYRQRYHGLHTDHINSRAALATLPVVRKHELMESQHASGPHDVFGGFSALAWGRNSVQTQRPLRVFASPGPIYEPEGRDPNYWRLARALFAAGLRAGDLVHNSFSYHFTPAGSFMETGAHALGCTVFPAGTGQTEMQVRAMQTLLPQAYVGTPSFLKIILDKADELGIPLPSLQRAVVSGEAFPTSLRDWLLARGIQAFQCYATADLGLIAYETSAREGLVLDEDVILEIVRPGTDQPLPDGEVGEVVVTTLNPDYPLIRFGTGDLSAVLPGPCPTGRSNTRIRGWLGRADQTVKVRGMFVHASQVAAIARRHPEVLRARLVVQGEMANDRMTLCAETQSLPEATLAQLQEALIHSMREVTKLRGEVQFVSLGSLPNDGKVVVDERKVD
ncbi:MAG: phenylacetate--CoA ligase family protein [Burkholderiales bacterium]